jgi:multicomponent Na+:H+ antiporter subunit G
VSALVDILSWVLLVLGGLGCVVGSAGLLRMPDFFTRMHAASVTDALGPLLIMAGLALQAGFTQASIKLLIILALVLFTSPAAAHALAKAALERGIRPLLGPREEPPSKS